MKTKEQVQRRADKLLKQFSALHPEWKYYNQFRHNKRAKELKKQLTSIGIEYKILLWVLKK